jgi:hypothetical protein
MKTHALAPRSFEFCFPSLDTLVLVEDLTGEIVIHASRNTFSDERKARFIRELAAEGFIPDDYRWLPRAGMESSPGIRWLIDTSCFKPDKTFAAGTRRFMVRLLSSAALIWLMAMGLLLLHQAR